MGEAEKVERLWFAETTRPPVPGRMASELDEPRLPRMQRQGKICQPHPHILPEPLGIGLVLEADDDVVNALGDALYKGIGPSRYGRPGRIPGSVQVSAATLVDAAGQGFTTLADAQAKFAAKGVTPDKRVIAYCGGGISATIDLFLLNQLGYDDITLYDASMGEWARDESVPVEAG